jgi:hypothetical protein
MPKYKEGLPAAQILLLGSFFVSLVRNGINFLVAVERQGLLLKYVVATLILNIILSTGLVHFGLGIIGLSMASAFSAAVFASLVWLSVFESAGFQLRARIRELFLMYFPCCIGVAILACLIQLNPGFSISTFSRFLSDATMFLVMYIVLVLILPVTRSWVLELVRAGRNNLRTSVPPISVPQASGDTIE